MLARVCITKASFIMVTSTGQALLQKKCNSYENISKSSVVANMADFVNEIFTVSIVIFLLII